MTTDPAEQHEERTRSFRLFVGVAVVVAVVIVALHLGAVAAFNASERVGIPIDQRLALARRANRLVPWNREYRARRALVETWKRADTALNGGDYVTALALLHTIVPEHTAAEPDLRVLYQRAEAAQTLNTNWKAHVLHGREGPGGTLRPQDLLP